MSGKVYLLGIGPGSADDMTPRAVAALRNASVIIGHKAYLEMTAPLYRNAGKEIISEDLTPVARSRIAAARALGGAEVAIVTVGDPGIFAIASTFFGYLRKKRITVPVEVIPGVTTASAAAARLGSPLGQDFAVVSLSDMATPWNDTMSRLRAATAADFVIALYNPKEKVGDRRIKEAIAILKDYRKASTPVGIVTDAYRETEKVQLTTLGGMSGCHIDTQSILIVGNSRTFVFSGKMITPRDYKEGVGY